MFIAVLLLVRAPKISKITVLTILRRTDEVQGNRETSGKESWAYKLLDIWRDQERP